VNDLFCPSLLNFLKFSFTDGRVSWLSDFELPLSEGEMRQKLSNATVVCQPSLIIANSFNFYYEQTVSPKCETHNSNLGLLA